MSLPWFLGAVTIRLFLLFWLPAGFDLSSRVEVATPINAAVRLTEGVFLLDQGVDPYEGVLFHEPPIVLAGASLLQKTTSPEAQKLLWIALDVVIAIILGIVGRTLAKTLLKQQKGQSGDYHEDAADLALDEDQLAQASKYSQLAYLYNPYTLLCCVAQTSTPLDNLFLVLFLLFLVRRERLPACAALALASYKGFYPIMLLVPLCVALRETERRTKKNSEVVSVFATVITFLILTIALLWTSFILMERKGTFLWATYGFILFVPELTPNVGLFWYFFTEMFEHFRVFFVCTFQLNVFVYVIPLAIRLKRDPFLLAFSLIALTAIFKSYPSYGDVGFYLSLLPLLKHLFPHTKQLFIVGCMFVATTALGPILYHLWIYNGSANANYFFAINLVFGTAQIFLVTDILFAYIKREFYLYNGYKELRASQDKKDGPRLVLKAVL